jgi:hypothetical protein
MSIAFEELAGSPTIEVEHDGVRARRVFRVAWDEWRDFARTLLGGWTRIESTYRWIPPQPFPGLPHVLVERIEVAPFDPDNPEGDAVLSIAHGANRYPDAGAQVTAHYRTLVTPVDEDGNDPDTPEGTVLTYSADLAAEYVSVPGRVWEWSDDGAKLPADENPQVLLPTGSYTLKWERVARPPWDAIRALRGKVNDAEFYGAAAGKLLFLGAKATRQFELLSEVNLWTIEYAFAERSHEWNEFYKQGAGFTAIRDRDDNDLQPYAEGDFGGLFVFGA